MRRQRCLSSCGAKSRCMRLGGLCWPGCMQVSATMWSPRWVWLLIVQVLHDMWQQHPSGRTSFKSVQVVWMAVVPLEASLWWAGVYCAASFEHMMGLRAAAHRKQLGGYSSRLPLPASEGSASEMTVAPPGALGGGPLCLQASSLYLWLTEQAPSLPCLLKSQIHVSPHVHPVADTDDLHPCVADRVAARPLGCRRMPPPHCTFLLTQPHRDAGVLLSKRCAHRVHPLLAGGGAAGSPGAHEGTDGGTDCGLPGWQVGPQEACVLQCGHWCLVS